MRLEIAGMNNIILYQMCDGCGLIADTRPFGLHHEEICVECSKKDEALTLIRRNELLLNYELFGDWYGG